MAIYLNSLDTVQHARGGRGLESIVPYTSVGLV